MTARREALVLPLIFLTVAWLGGLRVGVTIQLVPPPLISLVLGVMLVGTLVNAGVFSAHTVMGAHRTGLENVSGLVVLVTLLAASAQIFNLLTPERGIFHVAFNVCFFIQLATTLAGVKGRRNLLRSLAVLLGSALVVRFVVLEGLYAPDGGIAKRLLTTIVEGASLGTIQYEPAGAATGYVAFLTLMLYIVGIVLLPPAPPRGRLTVRALHAPSSALSIALIAVAVACSACGRSEGAASQIVEESHSVQTTRERLRDDALRAARVWHRPEMHLGATFGPVRVDLPNWRNTPVWHDRATCTISMSTLPYGGGTFPDRRISEAGRLLLAGLLEQLSARQLEDLFTASRIIVYDAIDAKARAAGAWVEVFLDKVRQIRQGVPCPQ
jgi:hypothetical protein